MNLPRLLWVWLAGVCAAHGAPAVVATSARALRLPARGPSRLAVTLVEADGTAWRSEARPDRTWTTTDLPLIRLQLAGATKLPLCYPGNWNRELPPAEGRGGAGDRLQLQATEHLQLTALAQDDRSTVAATVDISRIELVFE